MSSIPRGDSDRQPPNEPITVSEDGVYHAKSKDYGIIPAELIHDKRISDGAKVLYAHMQWRYGANHVNFEGRASMSKYLDVSQGTISNRIRELEAHGWIVVIERLTIDGQYKTPFYHVFQVRKAAHGFRLAYKCRDNERIRPLPTAGGRKTRKGIGGRPKSHENSSSHGDHENSSLHGVPEAMKTQVYAIHDQSFIQEQKESSNASNSPLPEKPDTDTQLISDGKNTVAAQDASHEEVIAVADSTDTTPVKEAVSPKGDTRKSKRKETAIVHPDAAAEPSPYYKPTQDERHAMFEAVCAHVFGVTDKDSIREMARGDHSRAGKIVSWLLRQNDAFAPNGSGKKVVVGLISAPANPQHVAQFAAGYKLKHRDASLPIDIVKFTDAWRAWASEQKRKQQGQQRQQAENAQRAADAAKPRATPEELAALKAEFEQMRRQLKEGSAT